ncbi:MAG UNVERIFIED_CONTAM: hypothetical protein LVR29_10815 [Microcystis novacekii LVE1205-3]|jgi:hypothetical protein
MNELNLNDLFTQYLDQRTAAAARDGRGYPDLGDAVPHDLTPVQPIDPRLAWENCWRSRSATRPSHGVYASG